MIKVTRLNREESFWINDNLIEIIEETPDTILTMTSGRKVSIAETADEIVKMMTISRRTLVIAKSELDDGAKL